MSQLSSSAYTPQQVSVIRKNWLTSFYIYEIINFSITFVDSIAHVVYFKNIDVLNFLLSFILNIALMTLFLGFQYYFCYKKQGTYALLIVMFFQLTSIVINTYELIKDTNKAISVGGLHPIIGLYVSYNIIISIAVLYYLINCYKLYILNSK
jgi:hypothetical protein